MRNKVKPENTSHQPSGLRGTHDKYTKHLLSQPCHDMTDEALVYFGEYYETGIKWRVAK